MLPATQAIAIKVKPKPRILLVDDESSLVEVIRDLLLPLNCTVKVARSVAQARRLMARESFELMLADVHLPDGDGFSLLPTLRKRHPTASAVILTGSPSVEFAITALRYGAADFVAKPFHNEHLLERIRAALSRQSTAVRQARQLVRLRGAVKRLGVGRRLVSKKVDLLCNDLVSAYGELSKQMDIVRTEESFRKQISTAGDLEQMLCQTMDWLMRQVGLANVALWLATETGDFQLGAYMKYTIAGDDPVVNAMRDGVLPRASKDGVLHQTGQELMAGRKDQVCAPLLGQDVLAVNCTYLGEPLATIVFFREQAKPFSDNDRATAKAIAPVFAATLASNVNGPGGLNQSDPPGHDPHPENTDSRSPDDWWKRGEQPPF